MYFCWWLYSISWECLLKGPRLSGEKHKVLYLLDGKKNVFSGLMNSCIFSHGILYPVQNLCTSQMLGWIMASYWSSKSSSNLSLVKPKADPSSLLPSPCSSSSIVQWQVNHIKTAHNRILLLHSKILWKPTLSPGWAKVWFTIGLMGKDIILIYIYILKWMNIYLFM